MQTQMSKTANRTSDMVQQTAETVGDTIVTVLDKLAGKKSELRLNFEDLTLDLGMGMKARMNGSISVELEYASETESK